MRFLYRNRLLYLFEPPLGDLRATYDDHLRLTGKRVVDVLLLLIELFSLGVTAEALRANIGSKSTILFQRRPVDPKFQVEKVAAHQPFFFSLKTTLNFLLYGIKSGQIFLPFCRNPCVWQTDGQTDRILITRPRLHSMQSGKNSLYTRVVGDNFALYVMFHVNVQDDNDDV